VCVLAKELHSSRTTYAPIRTRSQRHDAWRGMELSVRKTSLSLYDTITGYIEVFPCGREKAEVTKGCLKK
jgi:hypothetical protein